MHNTIVSCNKQATQTANPPPHENSTEQTIINATMKRIIIVQNWHLLLVFISACILSRAWFKRFYASDTSVSSVSSNLSCCWISS